MAGGAPAACDSLRATAELLRLPSQAVATAAVFFHRYRASSSEIDIPPDVMSTPSPQRIFVESPTTRIRLKRLSVVCLVTHRQRLISACLFLASKVEETPLRTNDLLNATKYVFTPDDSATLRKAFPGLLAARRPGFERAASGSGIPADVDTEVAAAPEGGYLAGDTYYAAKDALIIDEQVLLRVLRFSISVEHPHKYLLNMCCLLGCSQPLAHLATCLVNDSLARTQLCVKYPAAEVAAGALHLASLLLGVARDMPFRGQLCWWDALGFSLVTVEEVGHALFDVLLSQRQQQP